MYSGVTMLKIKGIIIPYIVLFDIVFIIFLHNFAVKFMFVRYRLVHYKLKSYL